MYFILLLLLPLQPALDIQSIYTAFDASICRMIRDELMDAADRGEITYGEAADIYQRCRKSEFNWHEQNCKVIYQSYSCYYP